MQDIFTFVRVGIGPRWKSDYAFQPSGIRPQFLEKLRVAGILLPAEIFERSVEVE